MVLAYYSICTCSVCQKLSNDMLNVAITVLYFLLIRMNDTCTIIDTKSISSGLYWASKTISCTFNSQYYKSCTDCMPWRHSSHLFLKHPNYYDDPIYTTGVHLIWRILIYWNYAFIHKHVDTSREASLSIPMHVEWHMYNIMQ